MANRLVSYGLRVTGSKTETLNALTRNALAFPTISALLIATSGFHIYYSQEARMYSMAAFFATLSIYSFVNIFKGVKYKHFVNPWVMFSVAVTLLIFTDYLPVFILPVFWMYAILAKSKKSWWVKFFLSHLPIFLFGLLKIFLYIIVIYVCLLI